MEHPYRHFAAQERRSWMDSVTRSAAHIDRWKWVYGLLVLVTMAVVGFSMLNRWVIRAYQFGSARNLEYRIEMLADAASVVSRHDPSACPSLDDLATKAEQLSGGPVFVVDDSGRRFVGRCDAKRIEIRWAGPDGILGNGDDCARSVVRRTDPIPTIR